MFARLVKQAMDVTQETASFALKASTERMGFVRLVLRASFARVEQRLLVTMEHSRAQASRLASIALLGRVVRPKSCQRTQSLDVLMAHLPQALDLRLAQLQELATTSKSLIRSKECAQPASTLAQVELRSAFLVIPRLKQQPLEEPSL